VVRVPRPAVPAGRRHESQRHDARRRHHARRGHGGLEALGKRRVARRLLDLWSYLGGKVPVAVTGRLRAHDGRGQFEMKSAEMAGVPVPKALVQQLLSIYAPSPDDKKPISSTPRSSCRRRSGRSTSAEASSSSYSRVRL
jgi:hypothetical protein